MRDSYFDLPSRIEDAFAEIDSDIVMDLLNTDEDYAALSDRMDKLKTQYPVIDKMNEDSGEIRMTAEEHRAYVDYMNDISTTKAVQRDLCRFSVGRNAKRVEKDTPYKKFFWIFSKNYCPRRSVWPFIARGQHFIMFHQS